MDRVKVMAMVQATSLDDIRIEVLGQGRAVTATGVQWVSYRDKVLNDIDALDASDGNACRVCGQPTTCFVNISFKAVHVCERCCLRITKQTVQEWTE